MEVPRHWRLKKQRYALVGETCPTCQAHLFPPRPICPHCGGSRGEAVRVLKQEPAMAYVDQVQPVER